MFAFPIPEVQFDERLVLIRMILGKTEGFQRVGHRLLGALQRAGDKAKFRRVANNLGKPLGHRFGLHVTGFIQIRVDLTLNPARVVPSGLAVAQEEEGGKVFPHLTTEMSGASSAFMPTRL